MIYVVILLTIGFVFTSILSFLISCELDRYLKANAKLASENYNKDVELGRLRYKLDSVRNIQNKFNRIKNNIDELNKDLGNLEDVLK